MKANYEAIAKALKEAAEAIARVTTGAVGGIAASVKGLTQQQIDDLVEALKAANRVIAELEATLTITVTDLRPAIKDAIAGEIDAVEDAIAPFVTPLQAFVSAAKAASVVIGLTISGLTAAETEFTKVVARIVKNLGIPGLGQIIGGITK